MATHPKINPLEKRIYKYKNPTTTFFCPLCRTERFMRVRAGLTRKNVLQLFLTSVVVSFLLYPFLGVRSFISFFFLWGVFELAVRSQFKKEVPCPHCGFDATWYKKDVKVAKKLVQDFWQNKTEPRQFSESQNPHP